MWAALVWNPHIYMKKVTIIVEEIVIIEKKLHLGNLIHQVRYTHGINSAGTYTFINVLYFKKDPLRPTKEMVRDYINNNGLNCEIDRFGNLYITSKVDFKYIEDGWYIVWKVNSTTETITVKYK